MFGRSKTRARIEMLQAQIDGLMAHNTRLEEENARLTNGAADHMTAMAEMTRRLDYQIAQADDLRKALVKERHDARTIGKALNEMIDERDALRDQLRPFLERREKAKRNLRQFKTKPVVAEAA